MRFEIATKAPSAPNLREHWAVKAKRVKAQRSSAMLKCPKWTSGPLLRVTLTRVAPRELDDDNLRGALKGYRDGVASRFGVDDRTPLIAWDYAQERCAKGQERVRVEVELIGWVATP